MRLTLDKKQFDGLLEYFGSGGGGTYSVTTFDTEPETKTVTLYLGYGVEPIEFVVDEAVILEALK